MVEAVALRGRENPGVEGPVAWAGVAYDGNLGSIGNARQFVTGFLTQLHQEHRIEVCALAVGVAELVVSELVTNVCKYAPGPCVVNVEVADRVLAITVWDTNPALPVVCVSDPGRIGGHGLELVTVMCEGVEARREPIGKRIKARVSLEPAFG
ncbi:ATP-binding protein [Streptomyces flavidovirens]|uniref:ATP-binding protein n=1 Tax=Streptomyces flavidovirens TaxID=67298 RepID=UPI0033A60AEE